MIHQPKKIRFPISIIPLHSRKARIKIPKFLLPRDSSLNPAQSPRSHSLRLRSLLDGGCFRQSFHSHHRCPHFHSSSKTPTCLKYSSHRRSTSTSRISLSTASPNSPVSRYLQSVSASIPPRPNVGHYGEDRYSCRYSCCY